MKRTAVVYPSNFGLEFPGMLFFLLTWIFWPWLVPHAAAIDINLDILLQLLDVVMPAVL